MFVTTLIVCSILAGQVDGTDAAETNPEQMRQQVRRLALQLDSNQITQREAAEQELIKLGPTVLDYLPRITPQTPAEVKTRLERVRKELEKATAEAAAKSSLVTLQGKMTLSQAIAAIQQQTGNKIADLRNQGGQPAADIEVELDLDKVPFWMAFDQLLDKAGLAAYGYSSKGELGIVARPENAVDRSGQAVYSGLFRIEPLAIEATRQLRLQSSDRLQLKVEVAWEPRSRPIALAQSYDSIKAVGDDGNSIPAGMQGGKFDVAVEGNVTSAEIFLPLQLPSRDIKSIASLQAELTALVPGRVETFEFDDLSGRGVEQEKAGVTVVLDQVRKNLELYEIRLRVRFDEAANALESHRGWIYENEAYLQDASQQRVDHSGLQATLTAPNEVGIAYLFDVEGNIKSNRFVYKTPALIIQMPVPYELKNIALP